MRKALYLLILLCIFVAACSQSTIIRGGKEIPYEDAAFQDFSQIQSQVTIQQDDLALREIDTFEINFPKSKYLSQVLFLKGEIFYRRGNYYSAATIFSHSARLAGNLQLRFHALYNQAVSLFHVTRYQAAADILKAINRKSVSPELEMQIASLENRLSPYVVQGTGEYPVIDNAEVSRNSIGVILPLTGDYSTFAKNALKGIQLGVSELQKSGGPELQLSILDDLGEPGYAQSAVGELIQKDHVIGIIGPLLGVTSDAAVNSAESYGVPIFPLSQKEGIAAGKNYTFATTMTNSLQAREIANFVITQKGFRRFAILYPDDSYGVELTKYFIEEVQARGGEIITEISYQPNQTDFRNEIKKLVKLDDFTNRIDEWKLLKEQKELELGREVKTDEIKLPPLIEFEALFIPDYPKTLGQVIPAWFAYGGNKNVTLLGANGWNSNELIRRAGKFVEGSIFVDTYFKESSDPIVQSFIQLYKDNFQEDPDLMSAAGFDTVSIIGKILKNKEIESRKDLRNALKNVKYFQGVTGLTSLDGNKKLNILTIKNGHITSAVK